VSTDQPKRNLDEVIAAACNGLVGDFQRLNGLMAEPHSEDMSAEDIARNLAEFGRSQMSGEANPSEQDRDLIAALAQGDQVGGTLASRFCAYVSGCILGWAALGQLNRARLDEAFAVVRQRAVELYPEQADSQS
jgi:hypothetical protein